MLCLADSDVDLEDLSSEMSRIVFERQSVTEVIDLTEVGRPQGINVQLHVYIAMDFYHNPLCGCGRLQ